MRLFVNTREVPHLKRAIRNAIAMSQDPTIRDTLDELLTRVELCEALQRNERRAKKEEETDNE